MKTTVGLMKKAINSLIKEGDITEGCSINEKTWRIIMDRLSYLQQKEKNTKISVKALSRKD